MPVMERETVEDGTLLARGELSFKLPALEDDDSDMISLKEWQPSPPSSSPRLPAERDEAAACGPTFKGSSVRTRFTPLEPRGEHDDLLPHGGAAAKLPALAAGDADDHQSTSGHDEEPAATQQGPPPIGIHHQHSISLVNGIAPRSTGGIAFDIIDLDDDDDGDSLQSRRSSRGSSLRVSFVDDTVDAAAASPSPPRLRRASKSPTSRARSGPFQREAQPQPPLAARTKSHAAPPWESSTKIGTPAAPLPKKFVRPTLHGIKVKKGAAPTKPRGSGGGVGGISTAVRSSLPTLEIDKEFKSFSNLVAKDGWGYRPAAQIVGRSLDTHYFRGGGEYDSASKLISSSLVSPNTSNRDNAYALKNGSRPVLPRSNGARKHDEEVDNGGAIEEVKVPVPCGGGVTETNKLTGDFGRLFSKLRRASAPLAKPSISKSQSATHVRASSDPAPKIVRANSAPVPAPAPSKNNSVDPSLGAQKYTIGSHASLKLLQECCSTEKPGSTPAYSVHKPRKIRDHEPHRHYYKTISKTLDQKLKS